MLRPTLTSLRTLTNGTYSSSQRSIWSVDADQNDSTDGWTIPKAGDSFTSWEDGALTSRTDCSYEPESVPSTPPSAFLDTSSLSCSPTYLHTPAVNQCPVQHGSPSLCDFDARVSSAAAAGPCSLRWKSFPPASLNLVFGAGTLEQRVAHLPLDPKHWKQLEELVVSNELAILHCLVNNYLQFEDPCKWETRRDSQVVNVAGYLNKNIRQKVHMMRNRPELVLMILNLRVNNPEIAQHIDGRMLQYLHDHLTGEDILKFAEYASGALRPDWSAGVMYPRVILHSVVKSFIQSVKERQSCCWAQAHEFMQSLDDRTRHSGLQQQQQHQQHQQQHQQHQQQHLHHHLPLEHSPLLLGSTPAIPQVYGYCY